MKESTVKVRQERPYTKIDNEIIRDKGLSTEALGLAVRILSLPPNKEFSVKYVMKISGFGRDKVKRLFAELAELRYLTIEHTRDAGRFGANSYILDAQKAPPFTENPLTENPSTENPLTENPSTEKPLTEKPLTENQATKVITKRKNNSHIVLNEVFDMLADYAGDDEALLDALCGFAEMRSKSRSPLRTERAATILLNSLTRTAASSAEKIAMLEKATLAGWSSVYPLSDREKAALGLDTQPQETAETAETVSETRRKELDGEWY